MIAMATWEKGILGFQVLAFGFLKFDFVWGRKKSLENVGVASAYLLMEMIPSDLRNAETPSQGQCMNKMVVKCFSYFFKLLVLVSLIRYYSVEFSFPFCSVCSHLTKIQCSSLSLCPLLVSYFLSCLPPSLKEFSWIVWEGSTFCTCFYPLFMFALNYTQPSFQLWRWPLSFFVSGSWVSVFTISCGENELPKILVLRRDTVLMGPWCPSWLLWRATALVYSLAQGLLNWNWQEVLSVVNQIWVPQGASAARRQDSAHVCAAHHASQSPFSPDVSLGPHNIPGMHYLWNEDLLLCCLIWQSLAICDYSN